ncbi:MAG: hypothetical protein WC799_22865 [Desulfobacteraceae bacterium]
MYFVTICTQNCDCFFGDIVSREMRLNDAGMMVQSIWDELPSRFANLELDAFVVMPNHIHGIFALGHANGHPGDHTGDCMGHSAGHCTGESCIRPCPESSTFPKMRSIILHDSPEHHQLGDRLGGFGQGKGRGQGEYKIRPYEKSGSSGSNRSSGTLAGTVGRMVQAFKSITTHQYIYGVRQSGWVSFPGKLWQRNYWEHVIRNESELNRIREYIQNNPAQWEHDKLYVHIQE